LSAVDVAAHRVGREDKNGADETLTIADPARLNRVPHCLRTLRHRSKERCIDGTRIHCVDAHTSPKVPGHLARQVVDVRLGTGVMGRAAATAGAPCIRAEADDGIATPLLPKQIYLAEFEGRQSR
jgi:hypothetical protein